ncbi:hypothetical protein [Streptomyces iconiensis]|uniref:Secreted protein n=1 Tax=Streptomyces iconiensis TaxID=1384038 RepID=A0ABT6ZU71_9ACTN|nr:hypothetical protein [Streptomyces iconiensis]MDJ1131998.1 hypothetical protein [Streptomyces iconiensis]
MTATPQARRTGRRFLASAPLAVFLAVTAPVATAAAAAPHTTAVQAQVFTCAQVDATDLPSLFAQECTPSHWGPISNFVVVDRGSKARYTCQSGWAEGSLWVQGQECRRTSTGS